MKPLIAIVGRPNVGKSTLFNALTRRRDAIVADFSGLTRDRQYHDAEHQEKLFTLIDTGGVEGGETGIDACTSHQVDLALAEADKIIFVVDARSGIVSADEFWADKLRRTNKPIWLAINKVDGMDERTCQLDFYRLGISKMYALAAAHRRGVSALMDDVLREVEASDPLEGKKTGETIHVGVVGRPNVGKSTLINRLIGEDRLVVYDEPGTTRDSIAVPFEHKGQHYTLIDTAGVRRRSKIHEVVEKFSVVKTMATMGLSEVVVFVIDASESLVEKELSLIGEALEKGCSLIILANKADKITKEQKEALRTTISRKLNFIEHVEVMFVSATRGYGIGKLLDKIKELYSRSNRAHATSYLTRLLCRAVTEHQPPLVSGRRIKLKFAHSGGVNPLKIVVHGNQTNSVPTSYVRYLENFYRGALGLDGAPIRIDFTSVDNPFKGQKNQLTARQVSKRKRLMKHVKR